MTTRTDEPHDTAGPHFSTAPIALPENLALKLRAVGLQGRAYEKMKHGRYKSSMVEITNNGARVVDIEFKEVWAFCLGYKVGRGNNGTA